MGHADNDTYFGDYRAARRIGLKKKKSPPLPESVNFLGRVLRPGPGWAANAGVAISRPSRWRRAGVRSDPAGRGPVGRGAFADSAPPHHGCQGLVLRQPTAPRRHARRHNSCHRGRKCVTADRNQLTAETPGSCSSARVQGHLRSVGRTLGAICVLSACFQTAGWSRAAGTGNLVRLRWPLHLGLRTGLSSGHVR